MNAELTVKKHRPRREKPKMNMTEGPLFGKIVRYSIPLILTGILSLLYNAADLIVVGNFAGSEALAAVSSTGSLNTLIVNALMGLSIGSSVIAAQHFGAREEEDVKRVLHTSVITAFFGGFIIMAVGLLFSRTFLAWMDTDVAVLDSAALYMNIIFIGAPANLVYNYCASILRASGDTKRPLIFLSISGIVNVLLNLLLVIVFHMSVAGVAVATITSQYLSAAIILFYLSRQEGALRFSFKDLHFDPATFKRIILVGIPCVIQGSLFSISNVMIQSSINSFGAVVVAGNGAGSNIEGFIYTSMNAIYQATLTFTGQNVGAKKPDRVLRTLGASLLVVLLVWCVVGGLALLFREPLVSLYVNADDPDFDAVVASGVERMGYIGACYFLCGMMEVLVGSLRGMGKTLGPAIISLLGACGLRVIWIYTIFDYFFEHRFDEAIGVLYLSYPVSWIITGAVQLVMCLVAYKQFKKRVNAMPREGL
ncbi:MAG: MATE family efflux transporter [Clostridia bacterium]|nr:MATE family efflux transporter [Clostridia bacterium]